MFKHKKKLKHYLSNNKIKSAETIKCKKSGGQFNQESYKKYKILATETKKKIKFTKISKENIENISKIYLEWRYYTYIVYLFERELDCYKNNPKKLHNLEIKNVIDREKILLKFKEWLHKLIIKSDNDETDVVLTDEAIARIINMLRYPKDIPEIDSPIK